MSNVPQQHKAAVLIKSGAPLEIQDRKTYLIEEDEVLIKVTATAINPVDWKIRDWGVFINEYPKIIGSDASGEIVQTGKQVKNVKVGDRVFFQGNIKTNEGATFQQYTKMPADLVGIIPSNVSDEEASGISLASMAAIVGLYNQTGLNIKPAPWEQGGNQAGKGKSIVILGGSSSVGQYAIQLARLSGFETIVTGSSSVHHDYLKKLGATVTLDRKTAKPEDYAKAATSNGHAFAMVFDSVAMKESHIEAVQILQNVNKKGSQAATRVNLRTSTVVTVYAFEDSVKEEIKRGVENGAEEVEIKAVWGEGGADHLRNQSSAFFKAAGGKDGWLAKQSFLPNRIMVVEGGLPSINKALDKNRDGVSGQKIIIRPFE
jgi:NADPH:quinone reductase-like Zn-dependent oxidoreductase